ncbi:MAG: META domain-containing protein [Planctomycetota bacterium]
MRMLLLGMLVVVFASRVVAEPLASWRDGEAKQAIIDFVGRVTDERSEDFVPVSERIAVFDNDGTLWCENPVPHQAAFAFAEVQRLLPTEPAWKDDPAVQALIRGDQQALMDDHHRGLLQILALTHAGITVDEFQRRVDRWLSTARHPRFALPYTDTTYQPMLEVLDYLREHGFETWIVSGGGQDFMRVFAEQTYGIPPQQVIGSHGQLEYQLKAGKPTLHKTLDTLFVDDREGKPVAIQQFIGRRPIACFGNSDGDQAMLEYTTIDNPRPSLGMIVHHTDGDREYAYDAQPESTGKLVTALEAAPQRGWVVADIKKDWKQVFPNAEQDEGLLGTSWQVREIDRVVVKPPFEATLDFSDEGQVSGSSGVNRYTGQAKIEGTQIRFGPLASSRMAGPPELMREEQRFLEALSKVTHYRMLSNQRLALRNEHDIAVVTLARRP